MKRTREFALEILCDAETAGRFVDELLDLRRGELAPRDRRLLQEIVYGAVRHRNTIDHLLSPYLRLAVGKQRLPVREALRLGAYQLVWLQRVPAHAAVDQTLEALKTRPSITPRDIGFVNAILQRLTADIIGKDSGSPPDPGDLCVLPTRDGYCRFRRPVLPPISEREEHLSLRFSQPRWLVHRWLERFGEEEARQILRESTTIPEVTVRQTRRAPPGDELVESLIGDGFKVEPGPRDDVLVVRGGDLGRARALELGWIQVQDVTAIAIGELLAPPPGSRVLDLCAAPGGKALQLLEQIGASGHLVAADRSDDRLVLVRQTLERFGSNFSTTGLPDDPARLDIGETFGHILVDVPCSNTGVLARRPDARWRLAPDDLKSLGAIQAGLLDAAYRHLRPGGRIVYATCSIEPEENEEQVAAFLERHPDLTEVDVVYFLPHRSPGDGGFASLLLKARA
jgi:16S rRNA (cytosine967-C5)-methyltransferase